MGTPMADLERREMGLVDETQVKRHNGYLANRISSYTFRMRFVSRNRGQLVTYRRACLRTPGQ
jgi:hypothetical protein